MERSNSIRIEIEELTVCSEFSGTTLLAGGSLSVLHDLTIMAEYALAHRLILKVFRPRSIIYSRNQFRCYGLKDHGLWATILPSFQTYTGVPCARAVFRAALPARRRALPTVVVKVFFGFFPLVGFMVLVQVNAVLVWNCHTLPRCPPAGGRRFGSCSSSARNDATHRRGEHCDHPV